MSLAAELHGLVGLSDSRMVSFDRGGARGILRVPASAAEACGLDSDCGPVAWSPRALLKSIYGIEVDHWRCPSCDRTFRGEDYPSDVCRGEVPTEATDPLGRAVMRACGRPLPRRCRTMNCENQVEPMQSGARVWYPPPTVCDPCSGQEQRVSRLAHISRKGGGVPADILRLATDEYKALPDRCDAAAKSKAWLESGFDRGDGRRWFHLWSAGPGRGKTVLAARVASMAVRTGRAKNLLWVHAQDLKTAIQARFSDPEAALLIQRAIGYELVVFDDLLSDGVELFSTDSGNTLRELARIVSHRMDSGMASIATSHDPPNYWAISVAVGSRAEEKCLPVEVGGNDLRRG